MCPMYMVKQSSLSVAVEKVKRRRECFAIASSRVRAALQHVTYQRDARRRGERPTLFRRRLAYGPCVRVGRRRLGMAAGVWSLRWSPLVVAAVTVESAQSELSNGPLPETLVLGERLGNGTFGEVFRAFDATRGREVAVKVISKMRQGADPKSLEFTKQRIEHEVSMWCELQSFPSAVRLDKFYEDAEHVYLVQELLEGGSVEDLMKVRGHLTENEVEIVMQTVLSLLKFCHEQGIAYIDLKPANLILADSTSVLQLPETGCVSDVIKVIDFGSCEHIPKNGLRGEKGTPLYTAPEVQHSRYGVQADVWSAGVLMYYLISGEIPFIGKPSRDLSRSGLNFYIQNAELKFEAPVWEQISQEAKDLIASMLERNVKRRVSASDALEHPWTKRLASRAGVPSTTFSDICPMTSPIRTTLSTPYAS